MNTSFPRLLGDIGGTNARWAWQSSAEAPLQDVAVLSCAENSSLLESASHYLDLHGLGQPAAASLGVATAISGDTVRFTNSNWSFSIAELKGHLQINQCVVINDFTALALSLPALTEHELLRIGGRDAKPAAPIALLGPGTGLGVSGLIPDGRGDYVALSGEGGHVTLASSDAMETEVLKVMRTQFGHVSAERVLSGSGLIHLYKAVCKVNDVSAIPLNPQQFSDLAIGQTDVHCRQTVQLFASFLGNVAGNLALSLGAIGGVYVGGGVVPRLGTAFDRNIFRNSFEAKGRFSSYLECIPCWLITAATPALLGASRALDLHVHAPQ
jgi:glucokinase